LEECQKQQEMEQLWQYKQQEMIKEQQKLTAENEVWCMLNIPAIFEIFFSKQ